MGPFSPDRTGTLPVGDLVDMCFSGKYDLDEMMTMLQDEGGLYSYLGTMDARDVEKMIEDGDNYAKLIYDAMAYQIGKEVAMCSTVLKGNVDCVIFTGGLSYSTYLIDKIKQMISFIAEIIVYPGEDEMDALNQGGLRVIRREEKSKIYEEEVEVSG